MKSLLSILLVTVLAGCAFPVKESLRPRTAEVYVEKGKSGMYGSDKRAGISVGFEFVYPDEIEDE